MITKSEARLTSGRGVGRTGGRRGIDGTGRLRLQWAEDARFARAPLQLLRERWLQQKFTTLLTPSLEVIALRQVKILSICSQEEEICVVS